MWGSQVQGVAESKLELGCCHSKARVLPICFAAFLLQPPLTPPGTIGTPFSHQIASWAGTMSHVSLVLTLELKVTYQSHVTASPQLFSSLSKLVTLWSQSLEGLGSDAGVSCGPGWANTQICASL